MKTNMNKQKRNYKMRKWIGNQIRKPIEMWHMYMLYKIYKIHKPYTIRGIKGSLKLLKMYLNKEDIA